MYRLNTFDLQMFGGKSSTTTVENKPAELTDDQKRMQKASADYAEHIQPSAYKLYDNAIGEINNAINPAPDYNSMYRQQAASTTNLQNQYSNMNSGLLGQLADYQNQVGAVNARNDANSGYLRGVVDNAATRKDANSTYLRGETDLVNNQLRNGSIPAAVQAARQGTINRMAKSALGNLLVNQAGSGTINSSAMDTGINGISQNVANTLEDNYSNDLNAYNAAMQQSLGNAQNYVNTDNTTAQQSVTNAGNWADYDTQAAQQGLANLASSINQNYEIGNGLLSQGLNLAQQPIQQANMAQQAAYQTPMQLLAASQGQFNPTNNIWQNANNGSTTTQTQSGGGGLLGGLLGIGGSALGQSWGRRW